MGRNAITTKKRKKIKNQIRRKNYEKNLSTQEKTEEQSARFPQENGNDCRQKGVEEKKSKGQKETYPLILLKVNGKKEVISFPLHEGKDLPF